MITAANPHPDTRGRALLRLAGRTLPMLLVLGVPAFATQDGAQDGGRDSVQDAGQDAGQDADKPKPNVVSGSRPVSRPPLNRNARLGIKASDAIHDFGSVSQGVRLLHSFALESSGKEAVIITHATPTCGCLVGEIKVRPKDAKAFGAYTLGDPIEPGTAVSIETVIETMAKQDRTEIKIDVFTNASNVPTRLQLNANVIPFLRATPGFLQLGDIPPNTGRTGTMDIRTSRGEKLILAVDKERERPHPAGFSFDLTPIAPTAEGKSNHWRVTVHMAPDAPEGPGGFSIPLYSDVELPVTEQLLKRRKRFKELGRSLGKQGEVYCINANVNFRVLGELSITPQVVSMGLVRPGAPVTRTVRLVAVNPDFDLSSTELEVRGQRGLPLTFAENFTTSMEPVRGMNARDIELTLSGLPSSADGSFAGELVVRTGHPEKPELIVRFSGAVKR